MSIKDDISGAELLADWLGEGGVAVSQMLAEFRATRCTEGDNGKKCPHNHSEGWWNRVKQEAAKWIRGQLELKNKRNLRVSCEDKLAMCDCCGCCLKLKLWTPLFHIRAHTPPEQIAKMPSFCWIKTELSTVK